MTNWTKNAWSDWCTGSSMGGRGSGRKISIWKWNSILSWRWTSKLTLSWWCWHHVFVTNGLSYKLTCQLMKFTWRHLPVVVTLVTWNQNATMQCRNDMFSCATGKNHRSTHWMFVWTWIPHIKIYHDFIMRVFLCSLNSCCCGAWHMSTCPSMHDAAAYFLPLGVESLCHFGALSPHAGGRVVPQLTNIDPNPFMSSPSSHLASR